MRLTGEPNGTAHALRWGELPRLIELPTLTMGGSTGYFRRDPIDELMFHEHAEYMKDERKFEADNAQLA